MLTQKQKENHLCAVSDLPECAETDGNFLKNTATGYKTLSMTGDPKSSNQHYSNPLPCYDGKKACQQHNSVQSYSK
jgi:hypothetical protein